MGNGQYEAFADVYSTLFDENLYDLWVNYVQQEISKHFEPSRSPLNVLDVACGDGKFVLKLGQSGYHVSGIDLSARMISRANKNKEEAGIHAVFSIADMTTFTVSKKLDLITLFCDSLCYLSDLSAVQQTFEQVYQALTSEGLFLFDIISAYQINEIYPEYQFIEEWDDAVFTWHSVQERGHNTIDHILNIFIENEQGDYHRFEEVHQEQIWPIETYLDLLKQVGFDNIEVTADFTDNAPKTQSKRLFFACQKGI